MRAIKILDKQKHGEESTLRQIYYYSMPNISDKIVRIILFYTDYLNRVMWNIQVNSGIIKRKYLSKFEKKYFYVSKIM